MAKATIDGIEVEVQDGINVVETAKAADVHVPHFCYHPALTVVGQCRMCLVEVDGMPKLQAGCSMPGTSRQRTVSEFDYWSSLGS